MSGTNVTVVMDAQSAKVVQAWQAFKSSIETTEAALGQFADKQRSTANETAKAEAAALQARQRGLQILKALETEAEAYARREKEIRELEAKGALSAKEAAQAIERLNAARRAGSAEAQQQATRQKELQAIADQAVKTTTTSLERYRQNVAKLREAKQASLLTEQQYSEAVRQQREELLRASGRLNERKLKEQELASLQQRVLQSIMTPQERYNRKLAELDRLRKANRLNEAQYAAAVRQTQNELRGATGGIEKGLAASGQFLAAATGIGSVLGGLALVVNQIRKEYDYLKAGQQQAAESQVSLAEAERTAVFNLGSDTSLTPQQMGQALSQMSADTGVQRQPLTTLFSDMLSARGEMSARDVLPYLQAVAKAAPDQGGLPILGGATLDLGKAFNLSPEQAIGFMLQTQGSSRVTSLEGLAQNVVPAILAVSKFGDSPEQAAELVAGLGQAGADVKGAMSGTAAVQLADRLSKVRGLDKLGSTAERIEAVRKSPRLQRAVFADEFGEAKYKPIFRQMLTGAEDSAAVLALRGAQAGIGRPEEAAPMLENMLDRYAGLATSQTAEFSRRAGASADRLRLDDTRGGRIGVGRDALEKLLQASGSMEFQRQAEVAKFEMAVLGGGADPVEYMERYARERADALLTPTAPTTRMVPTGVGGVTPITTGGYTPNAEQTRIGTELQQLANSLRELVQETKRNTEATRENTRAPSTKPNTAPPRPVASVDRQSPALRP